ncbi:hypothetical protein KL86DYS2_13014 [uncultured Dysgonomonas sp.]|uniref:Uncharacterized protein n=1 Tax=uncultured Dysgonomonas sp. TaxID=206096 RepID=A0A212K4K7_9BACT|nr:hypothetical protein KL86DYS2_13014 [uncultured Dysgonomonas sp.]
MLKQNRLSILVIASVITVLFDKALKPKALPRRARGNRTIVQFPLALV